jgi:transposase-like protein
MTDNFTSYDDFKKHFKRHEFVDHSKTFVRGIVHTNFAESYHSLLKRGIFGTFHHVSEKHLPRYLKEFEFRWNSRKTSDGDRTNAAIAATGGKRLTYKPLKATPKGTLYQLATLKA